MDTIFVPICDKGIVLKLNNFVKNSDKYRVKSSRRQKVLNHFLGLLLFAFIFLNALSAFAVPGKTTYQAKIVKPDGYPLEATSVNFKFTILDPAGSCILYSETYSSVNMDSTGGLISFALGSGVKTYPASATTFEQVFSNITPSLSCDTGGPTSYSPVATDIRKIVMQFHDGSGWQTLPAMSINAVPYAMYANEATRLNGLTSSDFVQVSTVPTCAASEALHYTGIGFTCITVGNSVTSGTVITALGYTPADGASVTTLTSNVSSVSSTVASVSSTVFSVSSIVTSLQNSVAASFAAITSSQWTTSGTNIFYNTGNIGIGTTTPVTKLDVSGGVRIGAESTTCAPALAGTLRYNASNVEYCNGTSWQAFGVSGAGITNFNGSTSGMQSFATGTGGIAPNIVTANGVHTLNIPLASTGSVTAGLISNTDFVNFSNKITSSAASIAQVLGYVPADNAASGTYAQKANNLSDLTNVATARTNLGLGALAVGNSIDLGSASATGIIADARLVNQSGVTSGTQYTKVTVDEKGRVTSGAQLSSSDVTTALGYTPANSATIISSQWSTSGTTINYTAGSVGIGTTTPVTKLDVSGGVRIGGESTTCAPALAGTLRYNASNIEYCNGTSWQAFGVSSSGLTSLNGSTSQTQTFANGTGGTAPAFNTSSGVHNLNIPLASTGSVTAGLISNTDYTTFTNKITSSAASIAQVLGYVPANDAASGTYAQKANNLSDLTNIAIARTNLGLGTFATASSIDLGSASATGTLAIARLPSFSGDATIAAASNTIILSNSGVAAGTYTKVTVDSKGRVTSGAQITSGDVTTALGYTPANSATIVSSQWSTSGTTINYMNGNVGVGITQPQSKLSVADSLAITNSAGIQHLLMGNQDSAGVNHPSIIRAANGNVEIGTGTSWSGTGGTFTSKFWLGDNGYVGIGTAAPVDKLHLFTNSGNLSMGLDAPVSQYAEFNFRRAGAIKGQFSLEAAADDMSWTVGGIRRVYVNGTTGNVGIGTTSPSYKFDVLGANTGARFGTDATNHILLKDNEIKFVPTGASYIDFATVGQPAHIRTSNASALDTTALTVLPSGNVGIGTTTPSAELHLAAGTSSNAPLKLTSGTLLTSPQSGTMEYDGTNFYLTDSTNTRRAIAANANPGTYDNVSNINSSSNITLTPTGSVVVSSTTVSTNSSTGALVVKGGLGVAGNLNVAGTISGSAKVIATGFRANQGAPDAADNSTNGYAFGTDGDTGMFSPGSGDANGVLAFYGNNTELMRITASGTVGIGTSTLSGGSGNSIVDGQLQIKGSDSSTLLHLRGQSTDYAGLKLKVGAANISGGSDYFDFTLRPSVGAGVGTVSDQTMIRFNNTYSRTNADLILNPNGGNVGIGTTTPGALLQIGENSASGSAFRFIPTNNQSSVRFTTNAAANWIQSGVDFSADSKKDLIFSSINGVTTWMTLQASSGNVGIGTTTPGAPLSFADSKVTKIQFNGNNANGYQVGLANSVNGGDALYKFDAGLTSAGEFGFYSAGTSKMFISSSGNVGIGTAAPTQILDVVKTTGDGFTRMKTDGVDSDSGFIAQNDAQTWKVYNKAGFSDALVFEDVNASVQAMTIKKTTGNIGIGTTSPAAKLHVNGDMMVGTSSASFTTSVGIPANDPGGHNAAMVPTNISFGSGGANMTYKAVRNGANTFNDEYITFATHEGGISIGERMRIAPNGNVGIGTSTPTQRLSVAGVVESTSGGFKFPDGSVQASANGLSVRGVSPANPATSCTDAKTSGFTVSGLVYITVSGTVQELYCEQSLNGGGYLMLYNSVLAVNTTEFWYIPKAQLLSRRGSPSLESNFYDGSFYTLGTNFMDVIEDLRGKQVIALVATATSFDSNPASAGFMKFSGATKVSGDTSIFNAQFASGFSAPDYDNDAHTTNCANDYSGVSQHYSACWGYNLGSDADSPFYDSGVGPHMQSAAATGLGLYNDGTGYTRLRRITRFVKF